MTRRRSSPLGLELLAPLTLAIILLPLLAQAAPFQDATEIQQYSEGCYYNYNHYNEGDRILTNEPCLNCTCHNKMLMCYLRVCPFTKPIGHDCIVEKREDQCCPIVTCPEVPVDVAHHAPEPGTELSIPEKYGCSIEEKFYPEGAQVPSNPNKPCELCYCIKNRTSCLMQECTLHIDGCTPIYNKGSCCPVRYNCDHENDVLELEDQSTTTTTVRPTPGFILTTTMSPSVTTDCIHNGELYADGALITGKNACEHCYCMRGDIVCAVQECEMPMMASNGKSCHPLPPAEGECCPSNYVCEDDTDTTQIIEATTPMHTDESDKLTTIAPTKDIHSSIPDEDILLQEHIDDQERVTVGPDYAGDGKPDEPEETGSGDFDKTESDMEVDQAQTTTAPGGADYDIVEASSTSAPAVSTTTDESKIDVLEKVDAVTSGAPTITITERPLDVTTTKASAFSEKEPSEENIDIDEGADQNTTESPFETRIDVTSGSSDLSEPTVKPEEDIKELKPAAVDEPHDEHVDFVASSEPAITEMDEHMIESSTSTASALDKEEAAQTEEPITEISSKEEKDKDKKDDDIEPSTTMVTPVDKKESTQTEASVEETSSGETTTKVTDEEPAVTEKDSHGVEPSSTIAAIVDKDAAAHTESSVAETSSEEDKDESISTSEKEDKLLDSTSKPHIEITTTSQEEVTADDIEVSTYTAPIDMDIGKEDSTPASISPEKTETNATVSDKKEVPSEETASESEEPSSTESIEDKESSPKPAESSEESTEHEGEIDFHKPTDSTDKQEPAASTEPSSSEKDEVEKTDKAAPHTTAPAPTEESVDVDKATVSPTTEEQTDDVTTISPLDKKPTQDESQTVVDESDHTTISSIDRTTVLSSSSAPVHDETADEEKEVSDLHSTIKPSSESIEDVERATAAAPSDDDHTTITPESSVSEEVPDMALPAVIPGEGDCLVDQKTYENNTIVSSSDECETSCRCISSVVVCQRIPCDVPENVEKCVVDEDSTNKCCPTYICGIDSAPSKTDSSYTSKEDEDEEITFTTLETPHKDIIEQVAPVDIEKEDETTAKLPSDQTEAEITTIMAPTDIIIPSISTEQPMSHVKDETLIPDTESVSIIPRIDEFSTEAPIIPDEVKPDSAGKPMHIPGDIITDDKHDQDQSTKTPVSEDKPSLGEVDKKEDTPTLPSSAEEIEKKPLDATHDYTVAPTIGDDKDEHTDEILSTTTPSSEVKMETITSVVEEEKTTTDTDITEDQTIAPSVDDSKTDDMDVKLAHTARPTHKDETSTDIPSIIVAPAVEDGEKEQLGEAQAHTMAPSIGGETESDEDLSNQTAAPSVEKSEKEPLDEILAHTTTPSVSEVEKEQTDKTSAHTDSPTIDKTEKAPIDDSAIHTISPSVGEDEIIPDTEDKKKPSDEVSGSTPAAPTDEENIDTTEAVTVTPITVVEEGEEEKKPIDEILSHTTAASIEGAEKDTKDEVSEYTGSPSIDEHDTRPTDGSLEHTESPSVEKDEEKPSDETSPHTIAPTTQEKQEKPTDALSSNTPVPTISESEKKPVDEMHTTVSSIAEDENETTDEIAVQTSRPSTEQDEKTHIDESIPPSTEDVTDIDAVAHTIAPTLQEEKEDSEMETSKTTDQPGLQDIQEVSTDAPLAHTIAPMDVEKDNIDELLAQAISPTVETPQKEPLDATLAHTDAPSEDEGSLEEATTAHTILPLEKLDVPKTDAEHKEDALEHTEIPSAVDDKHEPLDEIMVQTDSPTDAKKDEIDDISSQTIAPTLEDGKKDLTAVTDVPSIGLSNQEPSTEVKSEHKPLDAAAAHTVAPEVGYDDEEYDKITHMPISTSKADKEKPVDDTSAQTSMPSAEDITEKQFGESSTPSTQEDEEILSHTVSPSIEEMEKEPIDPHSELPSASADHKETVDEVLVQTTTASSVGDADEFVAHTILPQAEDTDTESIDQTTVHTVVPSLEKATTDEPLDHKILPSTQEKEEDAKPFNEKETHEETTDKSFASTVSTVPSTEETEKDDTDESLAHTVTPAVEITSDGASTDSTQEGEMGTTSQILDHTVSPLIGETIKDTLDQTVAHTTDASLNNVENDTAEEVSTHTISPMVAEEQRTDNIMDHNLAPIGETDEKKPIDETYSHTIVTSTEESMKEPIDEVMTHTTSSSIGDDIKGTTDEVHIPSSTQETEKKQPEDKLAHTVAPLTDEAEKEPIDYIVPHTIAPTDEEIDTDESLAHTTSPSIHDGGKQPSEESLAHTVNPAAQDIDDSHAQTDTPPVVDAEMKPIDESLAHTTASSVEEQEKGDTDEILAHSVPPTIFEKKPTDESLDCTELPITEKYEEKPTDEEHIITSSPQEITMKPVTQTISPLIEEGDKIGIDETLATTATPSIDEAEKEPTDEISAQTSAPSVEDEKKTPDESMEHMVSPSIEKEDTGTTDETVTSVTPSEEDTKKEPVDESSTPAIITTGGKVSIDEDTSHTTAISQTVSPSIEDGTKKPIDEYVEHTPSTSIPSDADDESVAHTVHPTLAEGEKEEKHKPTDETLSHTVAPTSDEEEKEPIAAHTAHPLAEDEENVGEETHSTTTSPADEIPVDKTDLHTSGAKIQPPIESSITEEPTDIERTTIASITTAVQEDTVVQSIVTPVDAEKPDQKPESMNESETSRPILTLSRTTVAPTISAKPTHGASVEASLDSTEDSDESMESAEEMTTEHKVQQIGEFVTERIIEGSTTEKTQGSKSDSSEISEDEDTATALPPHVIDAEDHEAGVTEEPHLILEDIVSPTAEPDTVPLTQDAEKAEAITTKPHIAAQETPVESATGGAAPEISTQKTDSDTGDQEKEEASKDHKDETVAATTVQAPLSQQDIAFKPSLDTRIDDSSITDGERIEATTAKDEEMEAATELPSTAASTTTSTTTESPVTAAAPAAQYPPPPAPPGYGQPPHYPAYGEDEYTDEDESEVFGPGTCRYGGKLYVSAQQIPRDDPCDFCFCFRSDIICLQQSCPPPIAGCHEEPISGFCCPRYECPVSMATVLNITTSTTTTSTTLPPHFLHHSYGGAVQRNGCQINGRSYRVGEKIESTSGPCINCTCGGDGKMKCDPQACVPEPTMQQVMAVVAAGRKR